MKECKLIAIAAVSIDGVIGIGNEIPWHIPEDFKHFKQTTMGHTLLVGYNTYLTLPNKALNGRDLIVLYGDNDISSFVEYTNVFFCKDLVELNTMLYERDVDILYIIGGSMIYDIFIDNCDEAIITWVNKSYPNGTKTFPIVKLFANFVIDEDQDWQRSTGGMLYKVTNYKRENGKN